MRSLVTFRGLAIIAVVMNHSVGGAMYALTFWGFKFGSGVPAPDNTWTTGPAYYVLLGMAQLVIFAVPVFLFAAGFYMSYAIRINGGKASWRLARTSLENLLPPFMIWFILDLALYLLANAISTADSKPTALDIVRDAASEYYFVPLLALLYAATPLFGRLTTKRISVLTTLLGLFAIMFYGRPILSILGAPVPSVLSILDSWPGLFLYTGWSVSSFVALAFYYALGLLVASAHEPWQRVLANSRGVLMVAVPLLGILSVAEANAIIPFVSHWVPFVFGLSSILYTTAVVLAVLAWRWSGGFFRAQLDWLGRQSLGIYLMQPVCLTLMIKLLYHVAPGVLGIAGLYTTLLLAAGLGMPALMITAVSRFSDVRLSRMIFGIAGRPSHSPVRPQLATAASG